MGQIITFKDQELRGPVIVTWRLSFSNGIHVKYFT